MPKGYHHLTQDKRCQLCILKTSGESIENIAEKLEAHQSTLYRELTRNQGLKGYRFQEAHKMACERKKTVANNGLKITEELIAIIESKLTLQWSPEQIAGWLKKNHRNKSVSHETTYKHVWKSKLKGGTLYKELRHHGKKYNKRRSGKAGRGCIPGHVDMSERTQIVEEKSRVGDWEIDTILGKKHKGVIVSIVDRHSKLTLLSQVSRRTAQAKNER